MLRLLLLVLALSTLWVSRAGAILDKSTASNTSNPGNGLPWDNLGSINGAGGIYLGNGWVLTPAHVYLGSPAGQERTITFGLNSFVSEGEAIYLQNPDPDRSGEVDADMVLFHLQSSPLLPSLQISSADPASGTTVTYVGFGHVRGSPVTYGQSTGYAWSSEVVKSWGTNRVNNSGVTTNYHTETFQTTFDQIGTTHEAQATVGDSGSGVFVQRNSIWELAGSVDTIATVGATGRNPSSDSLFGDVTNSANLATYRPQILSIISTPEPGAGLLVCIALPLWALTTRPRSAQTRA